MLKPPRVQELIALEAAGALQLQADMRAEMSTDMFADTCTDLCIVMIDGAGQGDWSVAQPKARAEPERERHAGTHTQVMHAPHVLRNTAAICSIVCTHLSLDDAHVESHMYAHF